jgi:DNA-binding GntR family transcriptional regulator
VLSPAEVVREIRKRLLTIARSRSFVDWQNRKALVEDLETQRRAIVDQVGKADPAEALDLMWRFLELAIRCSNAATTAAGR